MNIKLYTRKLPYPLFYLTIRCIVPTCKTFMSLLRQNVLYDKLLKRKNNHFLTFNIYHS